MTLAFATQRIGALADPARTAGPRTASRATAQLAALGTALNGSARVNGLLAVQAVLNRTGMPDALKTGVEALSGLSMDHVRVHRNSPKPAQLQAHAYAQGSDIHLAPGQERHLPHEAWHVVQQAQGRVRPTLQLQPGVAVNDDAGLEAEADAMGARALRPVQRAALGRGDGVPAGDAAVPRQLRATDLGGAGVVQRSIGFEYELGFVETYAKDEDENRLRLQKGHVLQDRVGFEVTADDPPTGSEADALSDLELRTQPINDIVPENRAVLRVILEEMVAYLHELAQHPNENAVGAGFVGAPDAGSYEDGVLQATVGLSLGGLTNLVSGRVQASATADAEQALAEKTALSRRWLVFGRGAKNAALDARMDHSGRQSDAAASVGAQRFFDACSNAVNALPITPAQQDILAAVMSRIITIPVTSRLGDPPYPKGAAGGLLTRTDFATIIDSMPVEIMNGFAGVDAFKATLLAAMRNAIDSEALQLADPVFPAAFGDAPPITLTLDAWLTGLYTAGARQDRLTTQHYPGGDAAAAEGGQLESLGSYGAMTDQPANGATQRPIFEFRNLGHLHVDDLVAQGLAVWDLVQRSNAGTEG
jgi:hypothetical protein